MSRLALLKSFLKLFFKKDSESAVCHVIDIAELMDIQDMKEAGDYLKVYADVEQRRLQSLRGELSEIARRKINERTQSH